MQRDVADTAVYLVIFSVESLRQQAAGSLTVQRRQEASGRRGRQAVRRKGQGEFRLCPVFGISETRTQLSSWRERAAV